MKHVRKGNFYVLVTCMSAFGSYADAASLTYHGGPVVSNANVVMVSWGSNVPSALKNGMPAFYSDIVQSDYWTIFQEYDVFHGQSIGLGTFAGEFTITPTKCADSTPCSLTDVDIDAELFTQVASGQLPPIESDAGGNVNSIYMVHFGPNVTIVLPGNAQSCVYFCSAETAFNYGSTIVPAGIIPDQSGACSTGCGGGATTYLDHETQQSMATLANLVTTPQLASSQGTVGWYDDQKGPISDICNSVTDLAMVVADGNVYGVPNLWSNSHNKCVSTDGLSIVKLIAGIHGTVSPNQSQVVGAGQVVQFFVTPDSGYEAAVGGNCGASISQGTISTNPVSEDCTVTVDFINDRIFADGFQGS